MKHINTKAIFAEQMAIDKQYRFEYIEEHYKPQADRARAVLCAALDEAQNRASVRTITYTQLLHMLEWVNDYLGISKKSMEGVSVRLDYHSQKFPSAYKYQPMSTIVWATFKSGSWRITKIERDTCLDTGRAVIFHTESSKAAILDRFSRMA